MLFSARIESSPSGQNGPSLGFHPPRLQRPGTYTALNIYEDEEAEMPMSRVLAIDYFKTVLSVTLSPFQVSRKGCDWIVDRAWNLGSGAVPEKAEADKTK